MTATIQRVDARAVRVPMTEPHRTASGVITESPVVLIDVHLDDGTVGHGLLFVYTTIALKPTADLVRNIAAMIIGQPLAPADIEQSLAKRFRLLGAQGLVGMALAGLDMALWDALARSAGTSLVRLLGSVEKPVRAYGAVGHDGVDGSARTAASWASRGLTGIKAKIGYATVKEDVAVVRAMRAAAGEEMAIMVDYNQTLTPAEACERIRVLDGEGLTWVEEPTLAHDFDGHAQVAREVRTPIQSGENWWGTQDLRHAIDAGASDFIMMDVMKIGGVTGWMRGAAMTQAHGLLASSHLWPEISAQLLCATPTAHWLEYADWWNPIIAEPLRLEGGFARVDGVLGTGVSWNEQAVAKFVVA
jgi:mandelate racemase